MAKPKGPKTVAFQIRIPEADYKSLKRCWHQCGEFRSFHAWFVNEIHKMAAKCPDAKGFPPTVVLSEESGVAVVDPACTLATILEIEKDKAADLLRRKRVSWRNYAEDKL